MTWKAIICHRGPLIETDMLLNYNSPAAFVCVGDSEEN